MLVRVFRVTDKLSNATLKSSVWLSNGFLSQASYLRATLERSIISVFFSIYSVLVVAFGSLRAFFRGMRGVTGSLVEGSRKVYEATDQHRRSIMAQRAAAIEAASHSQMHMQTGRTVIEDPLRTQNRLLSAFAAVLIVALIGMVLWSSGRENEDDSGTDTPPVGNFGLTSNNDEAIEGEELVPTSQPLPDDNAPPVNWSGSLIFSVREAGQEDLFVLRSDDSRLRLTNDPSDDRDPVWSPDGQTIAFASERTGPWEIYVMNVITKDIRCLTCDDPALLFAAGPSWSPDGVFIVFEGYTAADENLNLYLVSVDGSEPCAMPTACQVTRHAGPDIEPAWGPVGADRLIAYSSWRNGQQDVFVINLDNPTDAAVVNLTNTPTINENYPEWSPDGQRIIYTAESGGINGVFFRTLERVEIAGEPLEYRAGTEEAIGRGRMATWSPVDGNSLFYVIDRQENESMIIAGQADGQSSSGVSEIVPGIVSDLDWSRYEPVFEPVATNFSPLFTEAGEIQSDGRFGLADLPGVSAPNPQLNARVDDSFNALRLRINNLVQEDILAELSDAWWLLGRNPGSGQPRLNWHYTGRAFALDPSLIEQGNPAKMAIIRDDREFGTYWHVYLRVNNRAQDSGAFGEPLREFPWDFASRTGDDPEAREQGGKIMSQVPPGFYVDFTKIARDYGWYPVQADRTWRQNTSGMLYWMFIKTDGLSWEEAMRELYTAEDLNRFLNEEENLEDIDVTVEETEEEGEAGEEETEEPAADTIPTAEATPTIEINFETNTDDLTATPALNN